MKEKEAQEREEPPGNFNPAISGEAFVIQDGSFPRKIKINDQQINQLGMVSPLLWIQVRHINDYRYALLDSGSSINMINEEYLKQIPHELVVRKPINVRGATGESKVLDEWYMAKIEFQNGQMIELLCLKGAPSNIDLLLGMPFIKQVKAIIDARSKIVFTTIGDFAWGELGPIRRLKAPINSYDSLVALTDEQLGELDRVMSSTILSPKAEQRIRRALTKYSDIWTKAGCGHGKGVEHGFKLTDNRPIVLPPISPYSYLPGLVDQ